MKIVTAAIILKDNKVLIARKRQNKDLAGYWEFPGGKLEPNESMEDCLERELFEELGVKAKIGEMFAESEYVYPHGAFNIKAFFAEIIKGDIVPIDHDIVDFIPITELLDYNLAPADIPIAKQLIKAKL